MFCLKGQACISPLQRETIPREAREDVSPKGSADEHQEGNEKQQNHLYHSFDKGQLTPCHLGAHNKIHGTSSVIWFSHSVRVVGISVAVILQSAVG